MSGTTSTVQADDSGQGVSCKDQEMDVGGRGQKQ